MKHKLMCKVLAGDPYTLGGGSNKRLTKNFDFFEDFQKKIEDFQKKLPDVSKMLFEDFQKKYPRYPEPVRSWVTDLQCYSPMHSLAHRCITLAHAECMGSLSATCRVISITHRPTPGAEVLR